MSSLEGWDTIESRLRAVEHALSEAERGEPTESRTPLRKEIVRLFRETEDALQRITALRDQVRPLAERYRALFPREQAAPTAAAPAAATQRVDHLGSSTFVERGWSALASGKHALAEQHLLRARELDAVNPETAALLAWAQLLLGRTADAAATVDALLARDPAHALGCTVAGYVRLKQGDAAGATEYLSRALRDPGDRKAALYANLFLGMVYTQREMYRDARTFLARALEIGPNLVEADWEIGRSYFLEGDRQAAVEAWRTGAQRNRFSPWGERCGEAVARLEAGEPPPLD